MALVSLVSQKSTETLKRGRKVGVSTTPAVNVFASSGVSSGLPREASRMPWALPPVSRSL